jgi:hypothetical protein
MVETVPRRSAWNALGPFYSTTGIAKVLGGVSRQAIEERRRRRTLIALRTAEGTWVYPAFQLDDRNRPMAPVVEAHRRLVAGGVDDWTSAAALLGPQPELGDRSIVDHVRSGGDPAACTDLLTATIDAVR